MKKFKKRQIRKTGTLTHYTEDDKKTLCGLDIPQPPNQGLMMVYHPCGECGRLKALAETE